MANLYRVTDRQEQSSSCFAALLRKRPDDLSLAKESFKGILEAGRAERIPELYPHLSEEVRKDPMIRFLHDDALARLGQWRRAEDILEENGGLEVPDLREGETSYSDLYVRIRLLESREQGRETDARSIRIPARIDLRMNAPERPRTTENPDEN